MAFSKEGIKRWLGSKEKRFRSRLIKHQENGFQEDVKKNALFEHNAKRNIEDESEQNNVVT